MGTLFILILILIFGLLGAALIVLLLKGGMVEIDPTSSVVVKNIWTGVPRALLPGMHFIIPGWEERLEDVTLKNETSDPQALKVLTADPAELEVDYVIFTFKIPFDPKGQTSTFIETMNAVVKAATQIDYKKRQELVISRIKAEMQSVFGEKRLDEIYGPDSKIDKKALEVIEVEVNEILKEKIQDEWGFYVEVQIENANLPEKIQRAIEKAIVAEREGKAIAEKAKGAGVSPWLIAIGEMISDLNRSNKS